MPSPPPPPTPPVPFDEHERLRALERLRIRERGPEAALDGLVRLAAKLCRTASAEINVVGADDLWFCAARGMGSAGESVPRELTFCTWTILDRDRPLLVPDAPADARFADNPFVTDGTIGAYAGFPLLSEGHAIGTMCVHDPRPRGLDAEQLDALQVLAGAAQAHLTLRRNVEQLTELARTDALTGTANRRAVDEVLAATLAQAERRAGRVSFVLLDLDRFKRFNDTHGHQAGDLQLQATARAWRTELRGGDLLGRWGGEEFCAVLPDCEPGAARHVAERLRRSTPGGQTCSAGVAEWDGAESAEALVGRADEALYAAKAAGRDRVVVAEPSGLSRGRAAAAR